MADYSQTAANVKWHGGTPPVTGILGETVATGEAVYANAREGNKLYLCDSDSTIDKSMCVGVCLAGGDADDDTHFAPDGAIINLGISFSEGDMAVLSGTPGAYAPWGDLTTSNYVTKMCISGVGTSDGLVTLNILRLGVKKAATSSGDLSQTLADVGLWLPPFDIRYTQFEHTDDPLSEGWAVFRQSQGAGEVDGCQADTLEHATIVGVTLDDPATGLVELAVSGAIIYPGAAVTPGELYVVSDNAVPKWMPWDDLASSTDYIGVIGGAISDELVLLKFDVPGVQAA